MYSEKVINLCKEYLTDLDINKRQIENDFKDIYQVMVHKLPKVCILKENREGKGGNQTHIHITGESMKFFYSPEILNNPTLDMANDVKEYVNIYHKNLIDLKNRAFNKFKIKREFEVMKDNDCEKTFTVKKIGRIGSNSIQVQISKLKMDGTMFINLRECLFTGDYLIFLKKINGDIIVIAIPSEKIEVNKNSIINCFEEIELENSTDFLHPQNFREVNFKTIASYNPSDEEELTENNFDLSKGIEIRKKRTERHQDIVKLLASNLQKKDYSLFENPIDCLAVKNQQPILLFEIKTLNHDFTDEKKQVQKAFSQLCYYEEFYVKKKFDGKVKKIAVFENKISDDHIKFFEKYGIEVLWVGESTEFYNKDGKASLY